MSPEAVQISMVGLQLPLIFMILLHFYGVLVCLGEKVNLGSSIFALKNIKMQKFVRTVYQFGLNSVKRLN